MLLATKLHIPPSRPSLVARQRLATKLEAGVSEPIILLAAPAGFGKTTLLAHWVASAPHPAGWVSLDPGDNDPIRFLSYLVAALEKAVPGCTGSVGQVLSSSRPPSLQTILTILLNELCGLAAPTLLVLDDYHTIGDPVIHDAVTLLVDRRPPHLCIIIATRVDPPLPIARWRSCGYLVDLGADELRFTVEETARFLNDAMGLELVANDLGILAARTEGWIAGLQMAALSMPDRPDRSAFVESFSGSHRYIMDYLLEEVLARQSKDVRHFLLQTSVLERLCAPLCDAVTGRHDSREMLAHLERSNLFLMPLDDDRHWYRYHRLFSDLLREMRARDTEMEGASLHRRAGDWFESQNLVGEAVAHAFASGDLDRAAELVERHAMSVVIRGELATLSRWLDILPEPLVRGRPWLSVYRAWIRYWVGPREEADGWLEAAEAALTTRADSAGSTEIEQDTRRLQGHMAAIRAYRALEGDQIPHGIELARQSLALLPETEYVRYAGAIALGIAHWARGEVQAARDGFLQAKHAALKSHNPPIAAAVTCYVGVQEAKQGRLREAARIFREGLTLALGPDGDELLVAGYPLVKLADLDREWNNLGAAEEKLGTGLGLCRRWGHVDALTEGMIALARLCLAQEDLERACDALQETEGLVRNVGVDPWLGCWFDDCRIRYWLKSGNLESAIRWAERDGPPMDAELSYLRDLDHINLARVLVAWGASERSADRLRKAMHLLDRLDAAAKEAGWIQETIRILILQALALQAWGDTTRALAAIQYALALAEPGGYVRIFVDEGPPLAHLLGRAADEGVASDYTKGLLAALGDASIPSRARRAALVDPLSDREQEVLQLLGEGLSNQQIADRLTIALGTVKTHVHNIYGKLDARSRAHAIARARELDLI